ncbi:unnamed protein product [Rotaria magnacalcarata]|uniref:F-box domain-containing protein n=1 Tax=Rotaria magnacalcarata TaxID=392030 RepID=A0A819SLR0_9BILA|nr:unnamed protein product [Rotaria magnacalcarata]CAF4066845.1 unnamed protein product [Rotaria magnacalcarata]
MKESSRALSKKNLPYQRFSLLNKLPIVILDHIASYLNGSDALSYSECTTKIVLISERKFWQSLGPYKNVKYCIISSLPKESYYLISCDYFIQKLSDRQYRRFYYVAFLPWKLEKMTKHCNTQSFQTFVRLYSYSTHFCASTMPIYQFLDYSFMYEYRPLNKLEIKLFRALRIGVFNQNPIIISKISQFEMNLNTRFFFGLIKKWINFSCFLLAGGSVLTSLLINDVDTTSQDLDFFWIGGSWLEFCSQIDRFRRRSQANIIAETNLNNKVIEFVLCFDHEQKIRLQFIFGRPNCNISFVLNTFDIDVVQIGYNGSKLISTLGFHQAIAARTFISYKLTHDINDVGLYIDRCFKYNLRGFTWLCPMDFDDIIAQKPIVCASEAIDYGFNDFYFNVDSFEIQKKFLDLYPFSSDE